MNDILIPRTSRSYRTFIYATTLFDTFFCRDGSCEGGPPMAPIYKSCGTNLCQMIRTLFIWLPAFCLFQLTTCLAPLIALTLPLYFFGLRIWAIDMLAVIIAAGVVILRLYLSYRRSKLTSDSSPPSPPSPLKLWIIAKKQGICPFIRWQ